MLRKNNLFSIQSTLNTTEWQLCHKRETTALTEVLRPSFSGIILALTLHPPVFFHKLYIPGFEAVLTFLCANPPSSVRLDRDQSFIDMFRSLQRCLIRFERGVCLVHSRTLMQSSPRHSWVVLVESDLFTQTRCCIQLFSNAKHPWTSNPQTAARPNNIPGWVLKDRAPQLSALLDFTSAFNTTSPQNVVQKHSSLGSELQHGEVHRQPRSSGTMSSYPEEKRNTRGTGLEKLTTASVWRRPRRQWWTTGVTDTDTPISSSHWRRSCGSVPASDTGVDTWPRTCPRAATLPVWKATQHLDFLGRLQKARLRNSALYICNI